VFQATLKGDTTQRNPRRLEFMEMPDGRIRVAIVNPWIEAGERNLDLAVFYARKIDVWYFFRSTIS